MPYQQRSKLVKSLQQWKAKALARRQENVALKKRMVELIQSRDAWKAQARADQTLIAELQAENHRLRSPAPSPKKKSRPVSS